MRQERQQRQGIFGAVRERLFGHADEIAAQLHEIERQGRGMARLAHVAAFALVIAFSAGSLVALSGEALARIVAQWRAGGVDVPAAISLAVSVLLVVAMDVALVVAAANIRMLRQRRQEGIGLHVAVIIGVSLVEAATFCYMLVTYDAPTSWAVWLLIVARSLSAPLTAVYLSLARTLPVGARDILAQVELATGRGVIRDMVTVAGDPDAPLQRKLELYRAASVMAPADAAKLDALIIATTATPAPQARQVAQIAQAATDDPAQIEARQQPHTATYGANLSASQGGADTSIAQFEPSPAPTVAAQSDRTPDSPDDPSGGGLSPHTTGAAPTPIPPAPIPFVVMPARRPRKPAAVRARERAAAQALEEKHRQAAWAMIDADASTTANRIARELHIGHRKAKRHLQSWQRRQASRAG